MSNDIKSSKELHAEMNAEREKEVFKDKDKRK